MGAGGQPLRDSLRTRATPRTAADAIGMDLGLPRLRAHATAMLLAASAALAAAGATAPRDHRGLVVPLAACALAGLCAFVTWFRGEQFGDLTVVGLVLIIALLVTLTAAVSDADATSDVLLFLLPVVFGACFLPARLAICALVGCSAAYAWLVGRQMSATTAIVWWTSATLVLASATATVAVLRRELSATLLELAGLARCDPLTGLLNRRGFDDALIRELERCERSNGTCAVLMCDLDHFKQVNDSHGHIVGDRVLARVAGILLEGVRGIDTVARIGGEEIAVLLVDCTSEEAVGVADRLRRQVAASDRGEPPVTISIGIADSALSATAVELLAQADRALYFAKRAGRDRVCRATDAPGRPLVLAA